MDLDSYLGNLHMNWVEPKVADSGKSLLKEKHYVIMHDDKKEIIQLATLK